MKAMSALTGLLYAVLLAYLGGWYTGYWNGNFSLLLLILTTVTLAYWLAERFHFERARKREADVAAASWEKEQQWRGGELNMSARQNVMEPHLRQPWWLDWTAGLFPVILIVFLLRSFMFEPFKIPSGSMVPTLLIGDLILVNKFHYGIRLPVINKKIIANNDVKRGDVVVFRYPQNPSIDYIKRAVGLPGDEVAYLNQKLYINGKPVEVTSQGEFFDEDPSAMRFRSRFTEKLGPVEHQILVDPNAQPRIMKLYDFPYNENCRYTLQGVTCKVPAGHYFMMGDNRDNSQDSRFWGFVPDENIVGRAFVVWMNFGNLKRIGGIQ
ncbi:signal peptidase I [Mitsuaria sp. GD03876]|uniref:signal peptidase I n=1 Tax=Mitsuaria sp. GD03876 TaxID=2975399 RepID=UPI00244BB0C1|nr:signal peptidase I [Mitsuaria sp. GD03876]MDH0863289.1 signal peptidase I [Mitsuaria sp. GD03876]